MRNLLFTIVFVLVGFLPAYGGNPIRPRWIGNPPEGNNALYFVVVHNDASSSLDGARSYSLKDLASNVERTDKVDVNEIYSENSRQKYKSNGDVDFLGYDDYSLELKVEGTAMPIHSRRIDEYSKPTTRGGISGLDYYALYAVERKGRRADFSSLKITDSYGIQYMWRSAIVPGWGQMYKGSYGKGGLMMGGTVAFAAGIVVSESMRADFATKAAQAHSTEATRQYQSNINNAALARNICIGGAAALYIYNLVDAIVAPGGKRVIVTPVSYGSSQFGIQGSINF